MLSGWLLTQFLHRELGRKSIKSVLFWLGRSGSTSHLSLSFSSFSSIPSLSVIVPASIFHPLPPPFYLRRAPRRSSSRVQSCSCSCSNFFQKHPNKVKASITTSYTCIPCWWTTRCHYVWPGVTSFVRPKQPLQKVPISLPNCAKNLYQVKKYFFSGLCPGAINSSWIASTKNLPILLSNSVPKKFYKSQQKLPKL